MKHQSTDRKKAVALRYQPAVNDAPVVVGKGEGKIAEKILELAKEHDIPVQEDASLVEVLAQIDLNKQIPPELYQVVAEVMAFVYRLDHRMDKENQNDE